MAESKGRRIVRRTAVGVALFAAFVWAWFNPDALLGWLLLKDDAVIREQRPDETYEAVVPRYVEICALSQWRGKGAGRGNPFGHATLYLKGACLDADAPFPQLRRCARAATSTDDPEHGAGVSVGRWFRNVNWVATPSHRLFYAGDLEPGQRLTQNHYDATVRKAIDLGMFKGVELHPWTSDPDATLERFVAEESIRTDFALQYARNVFCARVPVTEAGMDEVIAFLNDKNREYATGAYDYNWSLLADNCTHTLRNALAAAHFHPPMTVLETKIRHFFNPAVPANEFVNLAILGAEGPLDDPRALLDEHPLDHALLDFRWLPTRHGALVKALPAHVENDLFDPAQRLWAVQSPFGMAASVAALELLSDPRHVDLETNLTHMIARYDAAIVAREAAAQGLESVRGSPYRRIERAHLDYLRAQRAEAVSMLADLRAVKAAR
jgi:hypothetical protein